MRILVVTHYFAAHGGGIELVASELSGRLMSRGFSIDWLASAEPEHAGRVPPGGIPVTASNLLERRFGFPYPIWGRSAIAQLRRATSRCDVLHLHDSLYMGNVVAYGIAKALHKPIVLTQHVGLVPYRSPVLRGAMEAANRLIAAPIVRGAAVTVFCSRTTERYFAGRAGKGHRSAFIANGVDTDLFRPVTATERDGLRRELGWPHDRPVLLFVGRFVEKKGLAILRRLVDRFADLSWVFVGTGPDDPSQWNARNVTTLGQLPHAELAKAYQAADLLVLPSVGEGFPLVVQESMACGTPVAITTETASAYPGLQEIVWHAEANEGEFERVLRTIVSNRADLEAKRHVVATFAQREWSWERCADEYAALFRTIAPSRDESG